jgi:hypothetical protein
MKRHVAATLLGVLGLLVIDSHVNWVAHDHGTLLEVSGQVLDPQGWASEHWRAWRNQCPASAPEWPETTAREVLQTIEQHSPPNSLDAQLLQLRQQGDWAMAEAAFKTLNPSIVVLHRVAGTWHILDHAVWSGSTAPWQAAHFVRRYLRQQAPDLPEPLLACFPVEQTRYGQGPGGLGPVNLSPKGRP